MDLLKSCLLKLGRIRPSQELLLSRNLLLRRGDGSSNSWIWRACKKNVANQSTVFCFALVPHRQWCHLLQDILPECQGTAILAWWLLGWVDQFWVLTQVWADGPEEPKFMGERCTVKLVVVEREHCPLHQEPDIMWQPPPSAWLRWHSLHRWHEGQCKELFNWISL